MLLKKAQLAHALGGDAAGGQVGDRAGGKLQARVRDVDLVGDHGNAQRMNRRHRRISQREQDIQIVNHHVVDHVDVQAARRKYAQPMYLKV